MDKPSSDVAFLQAMGFERASPGLQGSHPADDMLQAIEASKQHMMEEDIDLQRAMEMSRRQWQEEDDLQIAQGISMDQLHDRQKPQKPDISVKQQVPLKLALSDKEYLARVREVERRSDPDVPLPLTALMSSLRQNHPSLVEEIKQFAGATLKFDYLRACLLEEEGDKDDFEGKQRVLQIYEKLSSEDKQDLERSFHLADGQRDAFLLEIVTEDRRVRAKLGLGTGYPNDDRRSSCAAASVNHSRSCTVAAVASGSRANSTAQPYRRKASSWLPLRLFHN